MEKTVFLSITDADKEKAAAEAIVAREHEIYGYELNIENYEDALSRPEITPEFAKRLNELLATENREREKSLLIYAALKKRIAPANLQTAVDAAKVKLGL
jgi:hypothetical protein